MSVESLFGSTMAVPAYCAVEFARAVDITAEIAYGNDDVDVATMARVCSTALRNSLRWEAAGEDEVPSCAFADVPYFALRAVHRLIVFTQERLVGDAWTPMGSGLDSLTGALDEFFTEHLIALVSICDMSGHWTEPTLDGFHINTTTGMPDDVIAGAGTISLPELYGKFGVEFMEALDGDIGFLGAES